MYIEVDWMEKFCTHPEFVISRMQVPSWPRQYEPAWEKKGYFHRADRGAFVHYFHTDGKPTDGFGGASFKGMFVDGDRFDYTGAWSSYAGAMNEAWGPERRIVDVTARDMDGNRRATAMTAEAMLAWYDKNSPTWGLAWCLYHSRHKKQEHWILLPTRDGHLKSETPFALIEHVR